MLTLEGKPKLNLEEMKKQIESLVIAKGFYNKPEDIPKKLLFAFIELGEASDAWKKGLPEEKIAEELIDVIVLCFRCKPLSLSKHEPRRSIPKKT